MGQLGKVILDKFLYLFVWAENDEVMGLITWKINVRVIIKCLIKYPIKCSTKYYFMISEKYDNL